MAGLKIVAVENSKQQKQFFQLPWRLYKGDPNWIPPLRTNQMELLNYKSHPFYDTNRIQTFVAMRDDRPVGRIAAIYNQNHLDRFKDDRGFFGFFECEEDQEATNGLLDAAHQWLKDQGLQHMRGPMNPSMNYECGMLIEGFDRPPTFMMTYNPPYYPQQMEQYGLHKAQDMFAFYGRIDMLDDMDEKMRFMFRAVIERFDVKMRIIDKKRFYDDVRMFLDIYNQSLGGSWGFVPMTDGEIEHASKGLKQLIVPELSQVAEVDGRAVGAVFAMLDYNPRIKKIDGRLFPFGFIRLLWNRKTISRVRLLSTNVIPEFQKWGLGLVLTGTLLPIALERGITEGEFSWVLESNQLSRKTLERGGASREKTYRIYDTEPAPDDSA